MATTEDPTPDSAATGATSATPEVPDAATPTIAVEPTSTVPLTRPKWRGLVTPALAVAAALVVGGVAGVAIGQNTASSASAQGGPGGFQQGGPEGMTGPNGSTDGTAPTGPGGMGGLTSGTVVSVDGDTVVIETADGSQVTVTTSDDTTVTTTEESDVSDLATGDTVAVRGEADDDGNVTADAITEGEGLFLQGNRPATNG